MQLLALYVVIFGLTSCICDQSFKTMTSSFNDQPISGLVKRSTGFGDPDPETELDDLRETDGAENESGLHVVLHPRRWLPLPADAADDDLADFMSSLVRAQEKAPSFGDLAQQRQHTPHRKRQFNSWGGKRTFNSWGGRKRRSAPLRVKPTELALTNDRF